MISMKSYTIIHDHYAKIAVSAKKYGIAGAIGIMNETNILLFCLKPQVALNKWFIC